MAIDLDIVLGEALSKGKRLSSIQEYNRASKVSAMLRDTYIRENFIELL
jgi:hypothetical protein